MRRVRADGGHIAQAHLRNLNPFPANLGAVLKSYDKVIVPEMNLGQLALLLRAKYLVDAQSYNQVRGLPFKAAQLADVLWAAIGNLDDSAGGSTGGPAGGSAGGPADGSVSGSAGGPVSGSASEEDNR